MKNSGITFFEEKIISLEKELEVLKNSKKRHLWKRYIEYPEPLTKSDLQLNVTMAYFRKHEAETALSIALQKGKHDKNVQDRQHELTEANAKIREAEQKLEEFENQIKLKNTEETEYQAKVSDLEFSIKVCRDFIARLESKNVTREKRSK